MEFDGPGVVFGSHPDLYAAVFVFFMEFRHMFYPNPDPSTAFPLVTLAKIDVGGIAGNAGEFVISQSADVKPRSFP